MKNQKTLFFIWILIQTIVFPPLYLDEIKQEKNVVSINFVTLIVWNRSE